MGQWSVKLLKISAQFNIKHILHIFVEINYMRLIESLHFLNDNLLII